MIPLLLHFDQSAAGTLIAVAWQAALLTLVTALILRLLPRLPAAARFSAWAAVFLVLLLLPFAPHPAAVSSPGSLHLAPLHLAAWWSVVLAFSWFSLSFLRAVQLGLSFLRLRAIARRARPLPLAACAQARGASVCLSPDVLRPSVIGFFHPRILIPEALYGRLNPAQLDHVLLHEQQHLNRRDDWLNLVQKIGLVLFPLNPALYWVERRLCFEREVACDESVLTLTSAPQSYARSLVALAEHTLLGRQLALALGAWEGRSELSRRVHRILAAGTPALTRRQATAGLTLLCIGLVGAATGLARVPRLISFAQPVPATGSYTANSAPPLLREPGNLPLQPVVASVSRGASQPTLQLAVMHTAPATHATRPSASLRPAPAKARTLSDRHPASAHTLLAAYAVPRSSNHVAAPAVARNYNAARNRRLYSAFVLTVFSTSNGSPAYAAVPTADGWLFVQL